MTLSLKDPSVIAGLSSKCAPAIDTSRNLTASLGDATRRAFICGTGSHGVAREHKTSPVVEGKKILTDRENKRVIKNVFIVKIKSKIK